ncbi:MAG: bifunctional DNA-formamidopyrimidine glycosylase/DNA-(apurinic or apyrimidinic site) lyase [Acetobacteraceae bacterium]|nr:bifunctional DNA-formamidopyrimidine glycosylase/DNA-(apurinic or apyrimidinic site) lyase [Acetobacteraceae bacterium]
MPELPEVETVMRGLAAVLEGRVIRAASVARAGLRWPFPAGLAERLAGARVEGFRRRGKYMLMRLSGGDSVLVHLGMSGRMVARRPADQPGETPAPHEHLALETAEGVRVGFVDPRRFGCVDLVPTAAEDGHRLLAGLGPEPLEPAFTPAVLLAALRVRRTPLKAALLDQKVVAGLGNIYVSEALFRARLSPLREASSVTAADAERLVPAIRAVLEESIEAGGSSLRDYVRADGGIGFFQERFKVYGREGEPCEACPGPPDCPGISRTVQAGRSSFHCPRLQR